MREVAMMIWAMMASHSQPKFPHQPAALVRRVDNGEPAAFRAALDRIARCSTGKLAYDRTSGFYLPEQKADCK
jgi:hypothetical protein